MIIALILIGLGAAGLTWALVQVAIALESRAWPRTVATITHSRVSERTDSEGTVFVPNVTFRYQVEGQEIEASRIRVPSVWNHSWRGPAEGLVRRYPSGAGVTIAYDPDDPTTGVLEPGAIGSALGLVAFFVAWTVGSIALLQSAV